MAYAPFCKEEVAIIQFDSKKKNLNRFQNHQICDSGQPYLRVIDLTASLKWLWKLRTLQWLLTSPNLTMEANPNLDLAISS